MSPGTTRFENYWTRLSNWKKSKKQSPPIPQKDFLSVTAEISNKNLKEVP